MNAVADESWKSENRIAYRRLWRWTLSAVLVAILLGKLWPPGVGAVLVVAGFVLAAETLTIVPRTKRQLLLVMMLLAVATVLVQGGPWVAFCAGWETLDVREIGTVLFLPALPLLTFVDAPAAMAIAGWFVVVSLGSLLTFRYESLWPLACVPLFTLLPMPIMSMYISAMANA
jgi:hypothetical protein